MRYKACRARDRACLTRYDEDHRCEGYRLMRSYRDEGEQYHRQAPHRQRDRWYCRTGGRLSSMMQQLSRAQRSITWRRRARQSKTNNNKLVLVRSS